MATLEDILAATKVLDETSANPVSGSCSKPQENRNEAPDVKKDDGNASDVVITKQIVETVTVVESTRDSNSCLENMQKEKVEVGDLSRVSNGGTDDSINKIDVNVGVDDSSCGGIASDDLASDEKINAGEDSCTDNGESRSSDAKKFDVTEEKSLADVDGEGEENGEKLEGQDHGFCVGDFVWGKIKSHPWWPGQVYDPMDASEFAMKHSREGRLFVTFFGDASWSWCLPSQLKPFVDSFKEMSVDSTSKSFANALERAADEIGRLVESDMMCKCIPQEERDAKPLVSNAGVRAGVLAPDVDIHRLSVPEYKPTDILARLMHFAVVVSVDNVLEVAVLRSWLSAFYRAKGSYPLPVYCEPLQIEGMEDKSENVTDVNNDFSVPIEVPILGPREDDWLASPSANTTKSQALAEDKTYHRRKQKSVAELMGENPDVKPRSRERGASKEGKDVGKSTSSLKRRKSNDGEVEESGTKGASLAGKNGRKKKKEISELPKGTEEVSNAEDSGSGDNASKKKKKEVSELPKTAIEEASNAENSASGDDASKGTSLRKPKKLQVVVTENSLDEAREGSELVSTPRERKKSKYLCPPYTSPTWRTGNSSFKMGTVFAKSPKEDKVGEQTSKASGDTSISESVTKTADKLSDDKVTDGNVKEDDASVEATTQTVEKHKKLTIVASDVDMPLNDLVSDIQSAALDPFYLSKKGSLDMVWAFVSALRSAIYLHGPDYKVFQKCKSGKKRKSLHTGQGNQESDRSHEKAKSTAKRMSEEEKTERKAGKSAAKRMPEEEKTERKAGKSAAKRMPEEEKTEKKAGKSAAKRMPEEEKTEGKSGKSAGKRMPEEEKRERKSGKSAAKRMPEEGKTERKSGKSAAKRMLEEETTVRKLGKATAKRMHEEEKTKRNSGKSAAKRTPEDEKTKRKSGKSKSKKATETSRARSNTEKLDGNTSSCLVLKFTPEYPLPSKGEVVKLFSKYGNLNEEETHEVIDSHSVQIVYTNDSDAEAAFKSSLSEKPFGGENVIDCWLQLSPGGSDSSASRPKVASRKRAREDPNSSQPDDLLTDVQVIKQKLEIMSAIIQNYHTKFTQEHKSGLKDEMKNLLESVETASEKVRVMAENFPILNES